MTRRDMPVAQSGADWIARFAARLLKMTPELHPLDAVRHAMDARADASDKDPDEAAEAYARDEASASKHEKDTRAQERLRHGSGPWH